jgi:hypothetical protein
LNANQAIPRHRKKKFSMTALPRRSTELALPLIGATYAARMTQRIYSHLRDSLDWDEDINNTIEEIMRKPHGDIQRGPTGMHQRDPKTLRPLSPPKPSATGQESASTDRHPPPPSLPTPSRSTVPSLSAHGGTANEDPTPPGAEDPLLKHIEWKYKQMNRITQQRYLNNIRRRLDRTNSVNRIGFEDQDIDRAVGEFETDITRVDKELKLHLSSRT